MIRDDRPPMSRARTFSAAALCAVAMLLASCTFPHGFPHGPAPSFPPPLPPVEAVAPPLPEPQTPAEVRAEIQRWFLAHGYQRFQVAALLGHARDESGYHPCIAGPAGLHYTFQWGGTRLEDLHRFAADNGCPPLDKQLAFADSELRQNGKFACFWQATDAESALAALRRGFGRGVC